MARRPLIIAAVIAAVAATANLSAVSQAQADTSIAPTKTTCTDHGLSTTCAGTFSGDHAFDQQTDPTPTPDVQNWYAAVPTVTVSQTKDLGNQVVHVSWANFTPSLNEQTGSTTTSFQGGQTEYAVGVFECVANPKIGGPENNYPGGPGNLDSDCYEITNQLLATTGAANGVETFTSPDGTGQADIQIETGQQNSALGCSDTRPCSLAVVPNWGGRQDPLDVSAPGQVDCNDHTADVYSGNFGVSDLDTDIGLPCSWADRIDVPLSFAPLPQDACSPKDYTFFSQGSPMLERAMTKWQPAWCLSSTSRVDFNYNSGISEPLARQDFFSTGALTAAPDVSFTTLPADSSVTGASNRKFTYAPVSVSGISIAYYVDDQTTGQPITNLKLDARLVAKLITQSYSLGYGGCGREKDPNTGQVALKEYIDCDPAVFGNPATIFDDPEFLQLNHEYTRADFPPDGDSSLTLGTFLPTVVQGNSDLVYELTRWILSNGDAASFLQGNRDPWGMTVNESYRNEALPATQILPLDPGYAPTIAQVLADKNNMNQISGTMQDTWNPVSGLDNVANELVEDLSSAINPSLICNNVGNTGCTGTSGYTTQKIQPDQFGQRALFAIVGQGSAGAFRFPAAQLVNAGGAAVSPTLASMAAAVHDMRTNADGITQYADFTNKDRNAYPLTMVDYAMVPTCGLSAAKASAISRFLTNVTSPTTQSYGPEIGKLNNDGGYLTLDAKQISQTKAAATAVSTQSCTSPPPDNSVSGLTPPASLNGTPPTGGPGGVLPPTGAPTPGPGPTTPGHTPTAGNPTSRESTETVALGTKSADGSSTLIATALVLGALMVVGGPAAFLFGTTAQGAAFYRRVRRYSGQAAGRVARLVRR